MDKPSEAEAAEAAERAAIRDCGMDSTLFDMIEEVSEQDAPLKRKVDFSWHPLFDKWYAKRGSNPLAHLECRVAIIEKHLGINQG